MVLLKVYILMICGHWRGCVKTGILSRIPGQNPRNRTKNDQHMAGRLCEMDILLGY